VEGNEASCGVAAVDAAVMTKPGSNCDVDLTSRAIGLAEGGERLGDRR
jgi:hypothetical protein